MRALGVEYNAWKSRMTAASWLPMRTPVSSRAVYDEVPAHPHAHRGIRNRVVKFFLRIIREADGKVLANGETTHVIAEPMPAETTAQKIPQCVQRHPSRPSPTDETHERRLAATILTFSQLYDVALRAENCFAGASGD